MKNAFPKTLMSRTAGLLAGLLMVLGATSQASAERPDATTSSDADVQLRLQDLAITYLGSAHQFDRKALLGIVSRDMLEFELRNLLAKEDHDEIVRTQKLLFQTSVYFAYTCRGSFSDFDADDDRGRLRVTVGLPGGSLRPLDFGFAMEQGQWRVAHVHEAALEEARPMAWDFDYCSSEPNWANPTLLREDESLEEQRRRLGFPPR